jgi:hypothetical protein
MEGNVTAGEVDSKVWRVMWRLVNLTIKYEDYSGSFE